MEAQATFVRAKCAAEFNAETPVDLNFAAVILPGYPEDYLTLRLTNTLDDPALKVFRVFSYDWSEGFENFQNRLMELGFAGVAFQDFLIHCFNLRVYLCH
jgi:hypothetical protein